MAIRAIFCFRFQLFSGALRNFLSVLKNKLEYIYHVCNSIHITTQGLADAGKESRWTQRRRALRGGWLAAFSRRAPASEHA
ncbi:hypothetical protein EMEDMD4_160069 [Sinorhizobium medicae]|uniref:Uncharacterized protein n=1 Tax=Sinorhizobium medicae TaxID=110321 RepID=A0A508WWT5_9HYPH|nr:hypothetical protein EMEDMD4_160069 [Sinorhizobium medicae]